MEQRYPTQISMEEGMGLLLSAAVPMDKEEVRLLDASGRVLACDVAAMEDIPPFDRSPLDGYAVRAADIAAAVAYHQPVHIHMERNLHSNPRLAPFGCVPTLSAQVYFRAQSLQLPPKQGLKAFRLQ